MYLVKTPQLIQNLFPNFTWRIPTEEKVIYLTFDDGANLTTDTISTYKIGLTLVIMKSFICSYIK